MSMNETSPFVTMPVNEMKPQRVVQMERMHFHLEAYLLHVRRKFPYAARIDGTIRPANGSRSCRCTLGADIVISWRNMPDWDRAVMEQRGLKLQPILWSWMGQRQMQLHAVRFGHK